MKHNYFLITILIAGLLIALVIPASAAITKTTSFFEDGGNNYTIIKWTTNLSAGGGQDSTTWDADAAGATEVEYLVVAGGGSGAGGVFGGGGGAGGMRIGTGLAVSGTIPVKIGAGAAGGAANDAGKTGANSSFGAIESLGGGYGGGYYTNSESGWSQYVGGSGGSGGGAGARGTTGTSVGGDGTDGQGNSGGSITAPGGIYVAAGGGGKAAAGGSSSGSPSGNGGNGTASSITGVSVTYAGGGGGGGTTGTMLPGTGGTGGGGNGTQTGGGQAGTNGLGGGGGGGGSGGKGGDGGSGVVIIRYLTYAFTSNFTASNTSGLQPLLVQFTDTSTTSDATIDLWDWDFGDGDTSTDQNPDHTYVSAGTYVVNLTITNISHSLISTKLMDITVNSSEVVANFSANATTGYPNDYFQFSDLTSGTPLTWAWDFGDGNTSTDQNPVHQYTAVGLYDIALNVTNSTSFNSMTKLNYINISALPAPTVPTFTANKTYTTNPTLPVSFTVTSAAPPRMVSCNLSFGDGTWSNTTSSSFSAIEHTYSSVGVYSPTLYVYNAAGEAHTTSTDMIIISNPHAYLIDNPTIINYGIPSNLTLQLDNVSHVDVVTVNVTYNKTALEVKNVYAATGWSQQNTIGSGFVKINLTKADTSSDVNISAAYIQFNVTQSIGLNASEPINFVAASSGVVPNTSYTSGLYAFNKTYDGSITPTATAVTQTFNIYRTDTGELLSTVQVTNDYTGVINGSAHTTSGTFTITSLWGTVNLTSSASAFYANTLYGVEINGGTTNIYMTPYVPDNTVKLNQLYLKEVRFVALDTANGAVIPGIGVTAVSYNATYDGTNWETKLYGVSSAATSIQNTVMVGTTDAGGSITFPMISSNQYAMSFVNASAGINQSLLVFPLQTEYRVWVDTTGATNNTLSQISGSNLTVSEPNSSYVTLGMNYIDTSGLTENVTFTVTSQSNSTAIYTETITSGITAGVSSDYTIQNIRGDGFVWKYVAYRSDSSVLSQGAGVTMKGPNGVLVDMGLPSTGWYQWISMCCLFMLASLASQRTKQYWALLIPIFAAIFLWFGWFTGKSTLAGIVILCAVLGAIIYMKSSLREKFGIGGPGTMLLNIIVYLMILQACVGFINGLEIWSDAGMTNQAVTPTNAYMNIELTTISNLQDAAGLTGDIIATATIFVDMALTALGIFGFMLFSLITIYPTIQLLFPWMLQSAQTIALFALIQIGIWIMYVLFIYQTWYKPTIGTADF